MLQPISELKCSHEDTAKNSLLQGDRIINFELIACLVAKHEPRLKKL